MKRFKRTALALSFAVSFGSAHAQDWTEKYAGPWAVIDINDNEVCRIEFKPTKTTGMQIVGEQPLDASACPAPFNELKRWEMPVDGELILHKSIFSAPYKGTDADGDGTFTGHYGRKRQENMYRLTPRFGAALETRAAEVEEALSYDQDFTRPILYSSDLLAQKWTISETGGAPICDLIFDRQAKEDTERDTGGRNTLARGNCPAPFDKLGEWSAPRTFQIGMHNGGLFTGTAFLFRDPDENGIYEVEKDGAAYTLTPTDISKAKNYQALERGYGPTWARTRPHASDQVVGEWLLLEKKNGRLLSECRIRMDRFADRSGRGLDKGSFEAGPDCPPRLQQSSTWTREAGTGFIIQGDDGTALKPRGVSTFPTIWRLVGHKSPGMVDDRMWIMHKMSGWGAIGDDGLPLKERKAVAANVAGEWRYVDGQGQDCTVTLRKGGDVGRSCAAFWSNWTLENGRLIITGSFDTVFFDGTPRGTDEFVNRENSSERLTRR
ncbi:MAG: hypothetical protein AAGH90_08970 [Pseudomonadota bacterium]